LAAALTATPIFTLSPERTVIFSIRYFSSHKFRFYWISSAYRQEMDERVIQKVAGHASLEMTRHYNRLTQKQKDFSQNEMDLICGFKKAGKSEK